MRGLEVRRSDDDVRIVDAAQRREVVEFGRNIGPDGDTRWHRVVTAGRQATPRTPDDEPLFSRAQQNELGLYSAAEQAVLAMPLPNWKQAGGTEPGPAIWQKLTKAEGVKREELETLGLQEFLESGERFTRDDVAAFIRANGVHVEEVAA